MYIVPARIYMAFFDLHKARPVHPQLRSNLGSRTAHCFDFHPLAYLFYRFGIPIKNTAPSPGVLSTRIQPPCRSTNSFVIARPKPDEFRLP